MKKGIWIIGAILIIAIIAGLYISRGSSTGNAVNVANQEAKVINVDAARFAYSPSTITVKKGQPVKLLINNVDTTHGIIIPDLGVQGIDSVEFTPTKTGTFQFRCPTMCGQGHREMTGTLIVTD